MWELKLPTSGWGSALFPMGIYLSVRGSINIPPSYWKPCTKLHWPSPFQVENGQSLYGWFTDQSLVSQSHSTRSEYCTSQCKYETFPMVVDKHLELPQATFSCMGREWTAFILPMGTNPRMGPCYLSAVRPQNAICRQTSILGVRVILLQLISIPDWAWVHNISITQKT